MGLDDSNQPELREQPEILTKYLVQIGSQQHWDVGCMKNKASVIYPTSDKSPNLLFSIAKIFSNIINFIWNQVVPLTAIEKGKPLRNVAC